MSSSAHVLGRSVPRLEDAPLLKGHGQFAADIAFPHQLHMRIVRSPYAHAELRSVDVTAALAAPGVAAVWTGADIVGEDVVLLTFSCGLRPQRTPELEDPYGEGPCHALAQVR